MANRLQSAMRALRFSSTKPSMQSNLKINPKSALPPLEVKGGVMVKVFYASVDPVDYVFAESYLLCRSIIGAMPITPGVDFVGEVVESNHHDFREGELVSGRHKGAVKHGSLAEYTAVNGNSGLAKVPTNFDKARLCQLSCLGVAALTAYQCLKSAGFEKSQGMTILINGASGGTGTFGVQLAKNAFDSHYVIATCSGHNIELVKSLGADEVIDYRKVNVPEALQAWSRKSGGKLDLIIDNVGNQS